MTSSTPPAEMASVPQLAPATNLVQPPTTASLGALGPRLEAASVQGGHVAAGVPPPLLLTTRSWQMVPVLDSLISCSTPSIRACTAHHFDVVNQHLAA